MDKITTIRPGFLVALKTSVDGGVRYERIDLDAVGDSVAKWQTTKFVDDVEEYEAAAKCRNKARNEITSVCASTGFGLVCPEDKEDDLTDAYARAQVIVKEHNAKARFTRVELFVLKGRIASNDEEAARAITSEIGQLINAMNDGIDKMQVSVIREAANKAKGVAQMLGDEQKAKVSAAIDNARAAARAIVKRVEKGGEDAAKVLGEIKRDDLTAARFSFLDTEACAPAAEQLPAVEAQRFQDIDTSTPDAEPVVTAPAQPALDFDAPVAAPAPTNEPTPAALDFDDPPVAQATDDDLIDAAQVGDTDATAELARRGAV